MSQRQPVVIKGLFNLGLKSEPGLHTLEVCSSSVEHMIKCYVFMFSLVWECKVDWRPEWVQMVTEDQRCSTPYMSSNI